MIKKKKKRVGFYMINGCEIDFFHTDGLYKALNGTGRMR